MDMDNLGGEAACSAPPGWWDGEAPCERTIFTIGHSTRSFEEFAGLLTQNGVRLVADVRAFPGSRKNPQFGKTQLPEELHAAGLSYRWFPSLGGRRRITEERPETAAWRVDAFRAYANYTLTPEFEAALRELETAAEAVPTAVMCAEAQWTRCHRRLIANALVARGWKVVDIESRTRAEPHRLPDFARVVNGVVTYPAPAS
jgi:uncharacterized protein (DUF488 family)